MNSLSELMKYGQSYWLDNLTREMIVNGELKRRVAQEDLRGITSNPSTFNKAILHSDLYDDQIKGLARADLSAGAIYDALVTEDVQDACDILRPVYDKFNALDGYVSLEVSPHLAHDADGTLNEVRRLAKMVGRPNLFIKIPGTEAAVPAIEEALYEGFNVNITLLFGVESYEAVAQAYIRALERRAAEQKGVQNIASVASFFLSRIDVLVDRLLGHRVLSGGRKLHDIDPRDLMGKTAVANAKIAYQRFKQIFAPDRWESLSRAGARKQRVLWASTSTKNPAYKDVMYVEPLIGSDTVNTLPEATITAFTDHGVVEANSVEQGIEEAHETLDALSRVGIDLDCVTTQLVNEGIEKFIEPYDRSVQSIEEKRQRIEA